MRIERQLGEMRVRQVDGWMLKKNGNGDHASWRGQEKSNSGTASLLLSTSLFLPLLSTMDAILRILFAFPSHYWCILRSEQSSPTRSRIGKDLPIRAMPPASLLQQFLLTAEIDPRTKYR